MANRRTLTPSELAEIPPSVVDSLSALQPPAGVESNFVNPEDRGYILTSIATVLFCLMVCLFGNRVYTKLFIIRKAKWDDLTCTLGFLCSIAMYISTLWITVSGPVGKHQWDVRLVELVNGDYGIPVAIIQFIAPLALLFTKVTYFLLYFQVFRPLRWVRISVYIGAPLTCAFYGAASVTQTVFATPTPGQTWLKHNLSAEAWKAELLCVPLAAVGLGIDIVLLVIPIAAVVGLQTPTKRKIGVMIIFKFGIFACIGSLLSIYYRVVQGRSPDVTWTTMAVELVTLVEVFIGISCACMPALSKMTIHHTPALKRFRSVLSSRFATLRFRKSGDTIGRSTYNERRVESQSSEGASSQPSYELGQLQSVQTFIGKGWKQKASDDKIHLTHEIHQQQARMDLKPFAR